MFLERRNKGKATITAEISQEKDRNKSWGVVGHEHGRQETEGVSKEHDQK